MRHSPIVVQNNSRRNHIHVIVEDTSRGLDIILHERGSQLCFTFGDKNHYVETTVDIPLFY